MLQGAHGEQALYLPSILSIEQKLEFHVDFLKKEPYLLKNLLTVKDCLVSDAFNDAEVVIVMKNEGEYIGDGEIYINDKKAP